MVGLMALVPVTASAEERTCRGTIGATTLDNVRVPQNGKCVLKRTRVMGRVKVERNASLRAKHVRVRTPRRRPAEGTSFTATRRISARDCDALMPTRR